MPAGRYRRLALARPYAEIIHELGKIAEKAGAKVVGFHQMTIGEIAQKTGLSERQAELASQREFDEPFYFVSATERGIRRFLDLAKERRLQAAQGGRFWHLFAGSSKGRAVRKLTKLYRTARDAFIRGAGLGDSSNDLPMLAALDVAILLPKPDGSFDEKAVQRLPRAVRGSAPGPAGWNQAVLWLMQTQTDHQTEVGGG